jgi:hypothetical protein
MAMEFVWFDLDTTWQLGIHPSIASQTSGGNPLSEGVSFSYIWGGSKTTVWSWFSLYTSCISVSILWLYSPSTSSFKNFQCHGDLAHCNCTIDYEEGGTAPHL